MTKKEQRQFIINICDNLKTNMLEKTESIPENWDGYELRQYLADKASEFLYLKMDKQRKKNYENDILINNL